MIMSPTSTRSMIDSYLDDDFVSAVVGEAVGYNESHVSDECVRPAVLPSAERGSHVTKGFLVLDYG